MRFCPEKFIIFDKVCQRPNSSDFGLFSAPSILSFVDTALILLLNISNYISNNLIKQRYLAENSSTAPYGESRKRINIINNNVQIY